MYRDTAEEPLPDSFKALVKRLCGAKTNANTKGNGSGAH
jgi:hypothetical protein